MTTHTAATALVRRDYESPVGRLTLVGSDRGLRAILWPEERVGRVDLGIDPVEGHHPTLDQTADQLDEYFRGERNEFDLALDPAGTPFQREVWDALGRIPFGHTRTYGELADELGRPGAARAVGAATGLNPISVVIPCHRLVGADGSLTGFAGGLDTKRWLLDHESTEAELPFER